MSGVENVRDSVKGLCLTSDVVCLVTHNLRDIRLHGASENEDAKVLGPDGGRPAQDGQPYDAHDAV